jgi:hypothetical protein
MSQLQPNFLGSQKLAHELHKGPNYNSIFLAHTSFCDLSKGNFPISSKISQSNVHYKNKFFGRETIFQEKNH